MSPRTEIPSDALQPLYNLRCKASGSLGKMIENSWTGSGGLPEVRGMLIIMRFLMIIGNMICLHQKRIPERNQ
jgi:hypothetical protein